MSSKSHTYSEIQVASRAATSNRVEIETSRGIRLKNGTVNWDDLRIPFTSTKIGAAGKEPAFSAIIGTLRAHIFSNSASKELYFTTQVPHKWKFGGHLHPHVHWMNVAATTGEVQWDLEYVIKDIGDQFPADSVRLAATTNTASLIIRKHYTTEFPNAEFLGSSLHGISAVMIGRVVRRGDIDSFGADIAGLELDFHLEVDSFGSDKEYTKQ